jgi:DNA-binding NtrC family response regulator
MPLHSIRLGICSEDAPTRALLRRAAEAASCPSQSLDIENAFRWLSTNDMAWLLLDCAHAHTTDEIKNELGRCPSQLSNRVVLLQDADAQDSWLATLHQSSAFSLPGDVPEAAQLIEKLLSKSEKKSPAKSITAASTKSSHEGSLTGKASVIDHIDASDEAYANGKRLAQYPVDLLLCGETGSGKDSLARYIYEQSGSSGQFVPVNCAAIPENLAESELFGHEAGAFTGAVRPKCGKIEDADKGVLYLDEVDSCPLWLQAKLLRALQDKGVERVGSSKFRRSDFRLIASTKAHLPDLVTQGLFRQDLYFRLSVIEIALPPIRSQPDRLQILFQRFVSQASQQFQLSPPAVDGDTLSWLMSHQWPGNIRELKAAATRYALSIAHQGSNKPQLPGKTTLRSALDACERGLLTSTLMRTKGNVTLASDELGIPLNTLYYRLKRLGINQKSLPRFDDSRH